MKITTLPARSLGVLFDNGVAVTAGQFVPASDITTGNLLSSPRPSKSAGSATIRVPGARRRRHANGGGVDLDQSPNTLTIGVTPVNHAPTGADGAVSTLEDTAYTFAAADFPLTDSSDIAGQYADAVKITTLPARRHAMNNNGIAVFAGQFVTGQRHRQRQLQVHPGRRMPTVAATPASPSRCKTTAARPMAAVDLDPTANTMPITVTSVNDARQRQRPA